VAISWRSASVCGGDTGCGLGLGFSISFAIGVPPPVSFIAPAPS
jgi:hypothetical protein